MKFRGYGATWPAMAISIFHADNWKPAGQLSSVCKFALLPIYSDLANEGGWKGGWRLMRRPSAPAAFTAAVTIFVVLVARPPPFDRGNNDLRDRDRAGLR